MFVACTVLVFGYLSYMGQNGTPAGAINGRVLVLCFVAGSIMFRLREFLPFNGKLAILSVALSIVMLRYNASVCFAPLFAAYATVYLGMLNPKRNRIVNSGDYSYGLYLYAAPVQQTVAWALGSSNNWAINVALALPITVGFALFSWHFVEKPFLKVKRYVLR